MKHPLSGYFSRLAEKRRLEAEAALRQACRWGNGDDKSLAAIKELISKGVSPHLTDDKGDTLLHAAIARGAGKVIECLLMAGADPEIRDAKGRTAALRAAEMHAPDTLDMLLAHGADKTATTPPYGYGILRLALEHPAIGGGTEGRKRRDQTVAVALRHGIQASEDEQRLVFSQREELLPLFPELAAIKQLCHAGISREWNEALLAKGLHPDAPQAFGAMTPLFAAASEGNVEMVDKLLARGADPNKRSHPWTVFDYFASPLQVALCNRHSAAARRLMEAGGNPWQEIRTGEYQVISLEKLIGADMVKELQNDLLVRGNPTPIAVSKTLRFKQHTP